MAYHQDLLARIAATQQALLTVPAARVFIEREAAIERDDCPAIVLSFEEGRREAIIGSEGPWDLLQVSAKVKLAYHTRGDAPTTVADPVISESHLALMADPTLGGVALRFSYSGTQRRSALADAGPAGITEVTYEATLVIDERTLALVSP